MQNLLKEKIKAAMKSGDTVARDVLRVALSEIERALSGHDLPEDKQQAIIRKLIKSNTETISQAKEAGRDPGILDVENNILQELLPEAWTEEQIAQFLITKSIDVTQAKNDGQAMGMVMKALKQEPDAVVEASTVKKVVDGLRTK